MDNNRLHTPLLPLLTGIVAGVLSEYMLQSPTVAVIAGVAALLLIPFRKLRKTGAVMAAVSVGTLSAFLAEPPQFAVPPDDETVFSGIVTEIDDANSSRVMTVNVDSRPTDSITYPPFKARVVIPSSFPEITDGDIVSFSGFYSSPGRKTDIPMENDLISTSRNNSVSLSCFSPPDSVTVIGRDTSPTVGLRSLQSRIVEMICRSGCDDATSAFLCAVIAGDDSLLRQESRQQFATAGIAHVLALSGAHVAVIALITSMLFLPLAFAGYRRWRWIAVMVFLWMFAVMTGLSPSVVRSVIMASLVLVAIIIDRPRSSLNSLCFAAIMILIFEPFSLFKPGFQLSFLATAAIILFSTPLNPLGHTRRPVIGPLLSVIAVTVAATLGTAPLVAFHFHQLPVHFLLSNLLIVIAMPVMVTGGIVLIAVSAVGIDPRFIAEVLSTIYGIIQSAIDAISSFPAASVDGLYFSPWLLIPAYLTLGMLLYALTVRRTVPFVTTTLLAAVTIGAAIVTSPVYPSEELFVTRETGYTNIIIHRGDSLTIMTSSVIPDLTGDSVEWRSRYRDFIGSRHINTLSIKRFDDRSDSMTFRSSDRTITLYTKPAPESDYLLVTKSFRGDIVELVRSARCDTVLLSNDIHKRRHLRFVNELKEASLPVHSLRDSALSISAPI